MSTEPSNPNVEAICLSVHRSYAQIIELINGPFSALDADKLYISPTEGEWSLMQSLAHIVEIMPYWAGEIEKLVAHPGQNFGRTKEHVGRNQAIEEHGHDSLAQIKKMLPGSYGRLEDVLGNLKDSDLELTGLHPKYGEKTLNWFIEEFVTQHLIDHIEQMKLCLQAIEK